MTESRSATSPLGIGIDSAMTIRKLYRKRHEAIVSVGSAIAKDVLAGFQPLATPRALAASKPNNPSVSSQQSGFRALSNPIRLARSGKTFMSLPKSPAQPGQPFRIFVVDDNATIASSLAMILRLQPGLDVASFTDPVEALHACQNGAPDLLISDMYMPNLSGIELATQILERWPRCKVLLLSGEMITPSSPISLAMANSFEVLIKPIHPADLLGRIQRIRGLEAPQAGLKSPQVAAQMA